MVSFDIPSDRSPKAPAIGVMNLVLITTVCAVLGLVCTITHTTLGGVIFGAIGLLMGGFCMGSILKHAPDKKVMLFISVAALLVSVVAFMLGFMGIAESL